MLRSPTLRDRLICRQLGCLGSPRRRGRPSAGGGRAILGPVRRKDPSRPTSGRGRDHRVQGQFTETVCGVDENPLDVAVDLVVIFEPAVVAASDVAGDAAFDELQRGSQ